MAITSSPTVLAQSNDAYINAGHTGRLQTFSGSTGGVSINVTDGPFIRIANPTGNVTVTFLGIPANYGNLWQVEIAGRGTNTVTFNNVTWDGGAAPAIASGSGRTVLEFYSIGGANPTFGRLKFASLA